MTRQSLRDAAVDALWIAAAVVWSLAALVGRVLPAVARRLDRAATAIEDYADRDGAR